MELKSEEIKDLATSLAKAQSEMEIVVKDSFNPFYKSKYADFPSIVSGSRPYLSKNGLAVTQQIITNDDGISNLHTSLLHSSGQWMTSKVRINPVKNDVQSMASAVTYLKRMCYAALIGVVTGDEDDDGEIAVAPSRQAIVKNEPITNKVITPEAIEELVTKEQLEQLDDALDGYPSICEKVLAALKIRKLADMPKYRFMGSIKRIQEMKDMESDKK